MTPLSQISKFMKTCRFTTILMLALLLMCSAQAQETAPSLSLSKAAKLAEDAIASASLPADCFVRSVTLKDNSYYQVRFRPAASAEGTVGLPQKVEVIKVSMDGKVSFEQIDATVRSRVRVIR